MGSVCLHTEFNFFFEEPQGKTQGSQRRLTRLSCTFRSYEYSLYDKFATAKLKILSLTFLVELLLIWQPISRNTTLFYVGIKILIFADYSTEALTYIFNFVVWNFRSISGPFLKYLHNFRNNARQVHNYFVDIFKYLKYIEIFYF